MTPQEKENWKKVDETLDRMRDKGSYLLTLEMFKNFPFEDLNNEYYHPEDDE